MSSDTSVRVNLRASVFEISGSEEFVKEMVPILGDLLMQSPEPQAGSASENEAVETPQMRGDATDLGAFLSQKKLTKQSFRVDQIVAFVFFHTKILGNASAKSADILGMFESAGFARPSNLGRDLNSLMRTDRNSLFLISAGYGSYKTNIAGDNHVSRLGS